MHVVLISPNWPPEQFASGIVTYVSNLRTDLIKRGHKVTILVIGTNSKKDDPDVILPIITFRFRLQARIMFALGRSGWANENWGEMLAATLNRLHQTNPIDVIEMEESFGWCGSIADNTSIPLVVKLHGPTFLVNAHADKNDESLKILTQREALGLSKIDNLISPSLCTLNDTIAHYKLNPRYSQHIVNCIEEKPDLPIWSLHNSNPKTLLFVGRFDKIKGADILLRAFKYLLNHDSSLKLVFVGPNTDLLEENGTMYSAAQYVQHLFSESQRESIEFLGKLPPNRIQQLRVESALTIVASRWESQSYTALEAMLQGCPVVVADTGGLSEIVKDHYTGRLFVCQSSENLASVILDMLSNIAMCAELGQHARHYVLKEHSASIVTDRMLEAYTTAIKFNTNSPVSS